MTDVPEDKTSGIWIFILGLYRSFTQMRGDKMPFFHWGEVRSAFREFDIVAEELILHGLLVPKVGTLGI